MTIAIADLVMTLSQVLQKKHWFCAVAESCTGGLIAAAITAHAGSSLWFDCGFVTYSNRSKQTLLGVSPSILNTYGSVSAPTVIAMAEGALLNSGAQLTMAVSGIAGPEGGSIEKPVGTVWFAWAGQTQPTTTVCHHLTGSRAHIRDACIAIGLQGLIDHAQR